MLTLGMLIEMDDDELETNEIFGYKRHIDEINRVWERANQTGGEVFDIEGASYGMDGLSQAERDFFTDFKFAEKSFLPKELLEFLGRRRVH